jgi:hypothetical protein
LSEDDQAALILDDTNTLYAANLTKGIGVCWLGTDTQNEHYMPARPFRNLLHWFLTPRGYQLFHAGAIGGSNGAILLIGPSGCGKSTTCLNMLLDGFDYLGDDFVVVGPGRNTEGLAVFNVYNMARIRALPPILIENSDSVPATKQLDGKYRISLNPHFADRIKAELPLKGIVCPHLGSHSQGLVPVSASYGFRRALSTLGYLPGFEKLSLRHIGAYVSNVPCYSIELGNDYALTTQALAGLLSD